MIEPPTLEYHAKNDWRERPSRAADAMLAFAALLSPPIYFLCFVVWVGVTGTPAPWEVLMNAPKVCAAFAAAAAVVCGIRGRRGTLRASLASVGLLLDAAFMWWLVIEAIESV